MKKKLMLIIPIILVVAVVLILLLQQDNGYIIKLKKIDNNSPDRTVVLLKDNKEQKFLEIYYLDDVLLCSGTNPTINKNDVKLNEKLKVKLENKKIIKVKVKEEE